MGPRAKIAAAALGVSTAAVPGAGSVDGIPDRALVAYVAAAEGAPCEIPWYVFAAIGAVESLHGTHNGAHLDGEGRMTVMAVSHADAMGPMQFIGPTWAVYGAGGDVNDIDDAAAAAARLLCANGYEADPTNAIGAYNGGELWPRYAESRRYVELVEEYAQAYAKADPRGLPSKQSTPKQRTPDRLWNALVRGWLRVGEGAHKVGLGGTWGALDDAMFGTEPAVVERRPDGLDPTFGSKLDMFLRAAPGSITVVSGFRDGGEQMALRRQNCPDPVHSDSTECTPWTAKPGTSDHEHGLAADLAYGDIGTERWAHANAARYGLQFDVETEPWHVSLAADER